MPQKHYSIIYGSKITIYIYHKSVSHQLGFFYTASDLVVSLFVWI